MRFNDITTPGIARQLVPPPMGYAGRAASRSDRLDTAVTGINANLAFYRGDHWQNGAGWIGPMLAPSHSAYADTLERVRQGFVSRNVIREVVGRHAGAVLGKAPRLHVTVKRPLAAGEQLTEAEQALVDQAEALLRTWLESAQGIATQGDGLRRCQPQEAVLDAVAHLLLTERGPLRLLLSPGDIEEREDGTAVIPVMPLDEAIATIHIQHADSRAATIHVDKTTMQATGIYLYLLDDAAETEALELVSVDGRDTVIRVIAGGATSEARLPLNGRLTMHEMQRSALITEQVRQMQKALNQSETSARKNLDQAFLERVFFNVMLPGTASDGTAPTSPGSGLQVGPGTANFMIGVPIYGDDGTITGYATPSAYYHEPTPPETFTATTEHFRRGILDDCYQLHVLISGDATASGESRIQAKGDFQNSLADTQKEVESAYGWMCETVLAMAAAIAGQPGAFDSLMVTAETQIDLGVVGTEEKRQTNESYAAGTLSLETAVRENGIEDAEAEVQRIIAERNLDREKLRAELLAALANQAFVPAQLAAERAGYDAEFIAAYTSAQQRPLPQDQL